MKDRQVHATYTPRNKDCVDYIINPLGIVNRQNVIYLVCTLWNYHDVKQLALHRFQKAELLENEAMRPESFNLQEYIEKDQQFAYPHSDAPIQLQALFEPRAVIHLYETPLTEDQILTPQEDGRVLLQATILDTQELRWWLSSFGSRVEVVEPIGLRAYFIQETKSLIGRYQT